MATHTRPAVLMADGRYAAAIEMADGHKVRGEYKFLTYEEADTAAQEWFEKETAMPKTISSNIYGADDNDFAESIAADALQPPNANQYSGAPVDEDARSRSGADTATVRPGMAGGGKGPGPVRITSDKSDSRATTKGNHGEQG